MILVLKLKNTKLNNFVDQITNWCILRILSELVFLTNCFSY